MSAKRTAQDQVAKTRDKVIDAALANVTFDGWGEAALAAAVTASGVDKALAKLAFPRGGIDLALAYHARGDARLMAAVKKADLSKLRYSDKVARVIEMRLELIAGEREAVRKASAFFALPLHAADGARAIWLTADTIWNALGDTSEDINWYSKRATLSAVYSSSVLYWLGDKSNDMAATREFVARRIANVMQFEKFKARMRDTALSRAIMRGPGQVLSRVRKPVPRDDLPGHQPG